MARPVGTPEAGGADPGLRQNAHLVHLRKLARDLPVVVEETLALAGGSGTGRGGGGGVLPSLAWGAF